MKPSFSGHKGMSIRIHLFYSFLLHATILLYLLSLPIYRGGIHLKSFGDFFVHLISEEGKSSRKSPLEYKYKINKSNEGTLGKTKEMKTDLKTEEFDVKENMKLLEEEKKAVSEDESEIKIKGEEVKIAQAVEEEKSLKPSGDEIAFKKEVLPIKEKEKEVAKEDVHEAKEIEKKEVIVQESPPVEASKEALKPAELPAIPEKDKVASLEPVTDEKIAPSVEEFKEETMYLETEEKVAVTEKKEEHEKALKKEEVPGKVAEAKKPSEASEVGKVSKKDASSGKGKKKKVAKAEGQPMRKAPMSKAKKTASVHSKGKPSQGVSDVKKFEEAVSHTISTLAKKEGGISPETKAGDHVEPSADGVKGETLHIKDEAGSIAEIAASEKGVMPSEEDSFSKKEEIKQQPIVEINPEAKEGKKTPLGIPVSDVLLAKDIKIEVFFDGTEISSVMPHLLKKAHPMAHKKNDSEKPKEVDGIEEKSETYIADTPRVKRSFSVSKAEKGMYIFVIENKEGKTYEADVVFRLFEGKAGERIKEIKPVELSPHAIVKFKFILPETVFWDDEYYFTGTIESSDTLTKFNERTGLIWKEEKEY
jgi:hypothetical protein